jgi:hypothetical protein
MPPETPPHWRDKLSFLRVLDRPLFDPAFLTAWGDEIWDPNDEDRKAAAELHVQLISRITTQRLGYGEGNEVAALRSVHQFFEKKWHRQSEQGGLEALDATDVFRAELIGVQRALFHLDDLMMEIRDGRPARTHAPRSPSANCALPGPWGSRFAGASTSGSAGYVHRMPE